MQCSEPGEVRHLGVGSHVDEKLGERHRVALLAAEVEERRLPSLVAGVDVEAGAYKLAGKLLLGSVEGGPAGKEVEAGHPTLAGAVDGGALLEEEEGGVGLLLGDCAEKWCPALGIGPVDIGTFVK